MSDYEPAIQYDYDNVYLAFIKKRQSLELMDTYAKIISAEDENARFEARMRYLLTLEQKQVGNQAIPSRYPMMKILNLQL